MCVRVQTFSIRSLILKDPNRLYYEPCELMQFENIESQWPIFFSFYLLDGLFRSDKKEVGGEMCQREKV